MRMKVTAVLAVLTWLVQEMASQECSMTYPCRLKGGQPFVQPRTLRSSDGFLQINMSVEVAEFQVEWLKVKRRSYNGEFPGPTWMIKPGDTVNLTLTNLLGNPEYYFRRNRYQLTNHTNIHTHGLHISGMRPHDNPFVNITPNGGCYDYNYQIIDDHSSGTFYYHPHLHGSVHIQAMSGMSGMIIVEDPANSSTPQHIQDVSCPNHCEHDMQLVFQPMLRYADINGTHDVGFGILQEETHDGLLWWELRKINNSKHGTLHEWLVDAENGVNNITTNGLLNPVMNLTTGQVKRFRMVNAGVATILELYIADEQNNPACDFYEIAIDGMYLDKAAPPRFGKSFLVQSSKMDWLVVCNKPGTYYVKSDSPMFEMASIGFMIRYNGTLLTLSVTGSETDTRLKTDLPKRPFYISDFRDVPEDQIKGRFVVESGAGLTLNRRWFQEETFWRYNVEVDTVQEWYLTNTATIQGHPLHLHINSFQVISYNKYTGPFDVLNQRYWDQTMETCYYQMEDYNATQEVELPADPLRFLGHDKLWKNGKGGPESIGLSQAGVFRDIIHVPPLSNITIRFLANRFLGDMVIHCHTLPHEDYGMMMTVNILPRGADLNANVTVKSGNAYPGTCHRCDPCPFNAQNPCTPHD